MKYEDVLGLTMAMMGGIMVVLALVDAPWWCTGILGFTAILRGLTIVALPQRDRT